MTDRELAEILIDALALVRRTIDEGIDGEYPRVSLMAAQRHVETIQSRLRHTFPGLKETV